jgi:hypothetical protein
MRPFPIAIALLVLAPSLTAQAPTPQPVKPPQAAPPTGRWVTRKSFSKMDDSKTVTLSLDANNSISAWPSKTVTPTLLVRCQEGKVDVYVRTGVNPMVESDNLDGATVLLRFDKEPATELVTGKSTDGEALFFLDPKAMIPVMLEHRGMLLRFTPFNSPPQETSFSLRGLVVAIKPLYEACQWSPEKDRAEEERKRGEEERERAEGQLRAMEAAERQKRAAEEEEATLILAAEATIEGNLPLLQDAAQRLRALDAISGVAAKHPDIAARAVPALIELLKNPEVRVRYNTMKTLGKIGGFAKDAIPALKAIASDRTQPTDIKIVARDALDTIQ